MVDRIVPHELRIFCEANFCHVLKRRIADEDKWHCIAEIVLDSARRSLIFL